MHGVCKKNPKKRGSLKQILPAKVYNNRTSHGKKLEEVETVGGGEGISNPDLSIIDGNLPTSWSYELQLAPPLTHAGM